MIRTITPVYLTDEIRTIEQTVFALPEPPDLMEKAGRATAEIARKYFVLNCDSRVLVLAGPGNNGGDAFVAARYLKHWGYAVTVVFNGDPDRQSQDAKQARLAWQNGEENIFSEIPGTGNGQKWDLIIDGIFGIGLLQDRPMADQYLSWINAVNAMQKPVLAIDIPSGLGSDDGSVYGAVINADITLTFISPKPGILTHYGPQYSGRIIICDLDLDPVAIMPPRAWMINRKLASILLPSPRAANSHKGSFGNIGILGGNNGMTGAAILAGRAALHAGAGRVYLSILATSAPDVDIVHPELMIRSPSELFDLDTLDCLVIGPGMGMNEYTYGWLERTLDTDLPLVLDADALNHIAFHSELARRLKQREAPAILTPHPAEAARLLDTDTSVIQGNRQIAAISLSEKFCCQVLLKGAGSICARPDGTCFFNTSGNPGLSSAGTGDVLSGIIGALIVQGQTPEDALLLAVYLHGAAADELLKRNNGPVGMTASEVITAARLLLNDWIYKKS
ncbi:NAD(P)H-hydrate dehydratase [Nitrosomonas marina]|uniref:Bifunctional NAD(P)H-hydrate repair enzyme n=1 Tax=Nitrosomonas marina TaxID=917 RepID=A0A1H8GWT1_9PROT|nr:NAD(P)H-hydrate dehydratase [Nitrosomonas marina]SEN48270.1 yjeF C-terminal region, hydroxyethylthiazole kinase-related/yjeF N-terminal region [Nitrosomonas marina]